MPTSGLASLPPSPNHSHAQVHRYTLTHPPSHSPSCTLAHTCPCTPIHLHALCIHMTTVLHTLHCTFTCTCTLGFNHSFPVSFHLLCLCYHTCLPVLSSHSFLPFLPSSSLSPFFCPCVSDSLCLFKSFLLSPLPSLYLFPGS